MRTSYEHQHRGPYRVVVCGTKPGLYCHVVFLHVAPSSLDNDPTSTSHAILKSLLSRLQHWSLKYAVCASIRANTTAVSWPRLESATITQRTPAVGPQRYTIRAGRLAAAILRPYRIRELERSSVRTRPNLFLARLLVTHNKPSSGVVYGVHVPTAPDIYYISVARSTGTTLCAAGIIRHPQVSGASLWSMWILYAVFVLQPC